MKTIPSNFSREKIDYELIKHKENVAAIYEGKRNGVVVEYEVWKLRTYKQDYPLRKAYAGDVQKPSTREWGKFGWTYVKLETAKNKFGRIIDEMTKTQLIDNEDNT